MTAIDWLAKNEKIFADKIAIREAATGREFTYRQFNQLANRWRMELEARGIQTGDRVSVLLPNGADILFILFAAAKIGAIFVPLNTKLTVPELEQIVASAQPSLLIFSQEFGYLAAELSSLESLPLEGVNLADAAQASPLASTPIDLEQPQMLLYTSGTTGKPKGVIVSYRQVLWNALNSALRMIVTSDIALIHTPMFYTGGLNVYALPGFLVGATVVIAKSFDAAEVLRLIDKESITTLFAVPTQLAMMADSPAFETVNISGLRSIISGGAPCPIGLIERWLARGIALRQGFGMTEVGPNAFALDASDALRKAGSIGFPHFSVEARIVDEAGRDVVESEVGELIVRTPAMCSGYWNDPEQTSAAIRDGWLHTGDLARRDDEGYFYIVDRKKDMFISGGENVYPAEIEHLLRAHPAVSDVAVVGVPHQKWGEVGCAAIVLKIGVACTEADVVAFCDGRLARFKIPKQIVFVDELPRTVSGKVRKAELRRSVAQ